MLSSFADVSWIAVLIAVVASVVIGGLYFGAIVPKAYLRVLGREEGQPVPKDAVRAAGPLTCMALTVLTSALLIAGLGLETAAEAVEFGLVVGVGYLLAMTFQIALNPNFPHPVRYTLLNAPFFLVTSLVTSLVLVLV